MVRMSIKAIGAGVAKYAGMGMLEYLSNFWGGKWDDRSSVMPFDQFWRFKMQSLASYEPRRFGCMVPQMGPKTNNLFEAQQILVRKTRHT